MDTRIANRVQAFEREWRWLLGILLVGAAGALAGHPLPALAAALAVYAGRHVLAAGRLAAALRARVRLQPPFPSGIWRDLFDAVRGLQARNRKHRRRLTGFLFRFREAAKMLPDAVVVLGAGNEVEWLNPAAFRLLGLDRGAAGRPVTDSVRDPVFAEYLATGDLARPLEISAPENRALVLSLRITPFGRKRQRLLVARDVTRVYHLDRARRDLVANVSHELRTPLTVLSGYLEMLGDSGADVRETVAVMRQQTERMQQQIGDLLTLSRIEMADRPADGDAVPVAALLDSVMVAARALSGEKNHALTLTAAADLWLRGKESELRSAFSNLVFNAVRHTGPRTEVAVSWRGDGSGATFSVEDRGAGIAARHIPRLTESFYRVDSGSGDAPAGTGLGLAIVSRVLARHDAELTVDSRIGKGSTFACRFPASRVLVRPVC